MPQSPQLGVYYAGQSPQEASLDLGFSLAPAVGTFVAPGQTQSVIGEGGQTLSQIRHLIFGDSGDPIGGAIVRRLPKKTLSVDWLRINPEAQGGLGQMKRIVNQLLDYYPGMRRVVYTRVSGGSADTAAAAKSYQIPQPPKIP